MNEKENATVTINIYEYRRLCALEGKLGAVRAYCQKEEFPNAETMAVMLDIVVRKPLELYSPSNKDTIESISGIKEDNQNGK